MTKSTRSNDNSPTEMGELREMMQKLISEIGVLNGAVAKLKKLNQTVMELKEQLEGNRKDTTPTGDGIETSGKRLLRERQLVEEPGNKNPLGYQQSIARYSKLDFLRFSGEDIHLEGEAIQWHQSFMRYRQSIQPPSWNEYGVALVERFGAGSPKKLVLDKMPKRDLHVDSLDGSIVDINNETGEIEDLFLNVFSRDTESDVDALEDWSR
ncbi:hypothetical protein BC332_20907 [Capsicum chinense]|nr:hypothetical protein BC332_20907 [Capsicum chinense]